MTTPNEDLIARLRDRATFLGPELTLAILPEAADLLQSQAERIATLEGDVEYLQKDIDAMCNAIPNYHWSGGAAELIAECFADRDALGAELADAELHTKQVERGLDKATAQLAEIEKTEPVAWINLAASSKMFRFLAPTEEDGTVVKDWQPLFTRPMPAQDVTELVEALEMIVSTHQGHCEHYVGVSKHSHNLADIAEEALSKYKGVK